MRLLGELSQVFGDGTMRVTMDQNLRVPLGAQPRRRGVLQEPRGRRAGACRRRHAGGRDELPGRGVVQARGDAVARARPGARRSSAGAAGSRRGVPRTGHQDQRLPEWLRPASHRGHRLPGQPEESRRPAGPAVLRHGRRRRRRRHDHVRPPRGQDSGAAVRAGARAAGGAVPGSASGGRSRRGVLPAGRSRAVKAVLAGLEKPGSGRSRATGLHRSRGGQRVQPGGQEGECSA